MVGENLLVRSGNCRTQLAGMSLVAVYDARPAQFRLNSGVNFFAMNADVRWCMHPNPDLITFDTQHSDGDVVTDHEPFAHSSCQY